jgi:hypothetical protein
MPVQQPRLSREKQAIYVACLQQLQAEGRDVEIPEEWQQNAERRDVEIILSSESIIFEPASGGVYYAVMVRLTALRSGLTLVHCEISTEWDDQIVAESFDERNLIYELGRQEYRADEVLNHKIEHNISLRRGQIAEGWILASGLRPIPAEYGDHSTAPFELKLFDQFETEYAAEGTLSVLRRRFQRQTTNVGRGTGLYELGAIGRPRELSISEQSAPRYSERVTQEKVTENNDSH